jgi:putative DNA primase/helicase
MTDLREQGLRQLTEYDQWGVWAEVERDGNRIKLPLNVNGGAAAAVDNPRTWCSYAEAAEALEDRPGKYKGLAFFFTEEDPFFCIDLDSCVRDMRISDDARAMIDRFGTYAELSQSKHGIHIIGKGTKHTERCRKDGIEIYDRKRFLAITGDRIYEVGDVIDCQDELDKLTTELWPPKPETKPATPAFMNAGELDGGEVLARMFAGKNGPILEDLYRRGVSDAEDHSAADMAFCNALAFWTRRDAGLMDRIFRGSALMRPKWDRSVGAAGKYGEATIRKACEDCAEVWEPAPETDVSDYAAEISSGAVAAALHSEETPEAQKPAPLQNEPELAGILADSIFAGRWKYETDTELWYYYDEEKGCWQEDEADLKESLIADSLTRMARKAGDKSAFKWLNSMNCLSHYKGLLKAVSRDPRIYTTSHRFSPLPRYIACASGVLDLEQGCVTVEPDPELKVKDWYPWEYDPGNPRIPDVARLYDTWSAGCPETAALLKQIGGLCLSRYPVKKIIYIQGETDSGKSYHTALIAALAGPKNSVSVDKNLFVNTQIIDKDAMIKELMGRTMAYTSEDKAGQKADVSMIKQLTGGDGGELITARGKYQKRYKQFRNYATMIISTNYIPDFGGLSDSAVINRLMIVPFEHVFAEEEKEDLSTYTEDKQFMDALFTVCVSALADWLRNRKRFALPAKVKAKTEEALRSQDDLQAFIDDILGEPVEKDHIYLYNTRNSVWFAWKQYCYEESIRDDRKKATILREICRRRGISENFRAYTSSGIDYIYGVDSDRVKELENRYKERVRI